MIEIPGRIPLAIHPFFWVFAALIGWMNSQTILGTLIWVGIIVVSVVVHEFGHAITAVLFKQKARIQLIALGGVTPFGAIRPQVLPLSGTRTPAHCGGPPPDFAPLGILRSIIQ
jgi:hypothetical protein